MGEPQCHSRCALFVISSPSSHYVLLDGKQGVAAFYSKKEYQEIRHNGRGLFITPGPTPDEEMGQANIPESGIFQKKKTKSGVRKSLHWRHGQGAGCVGVAC